MYNVWSINTRNNKILWLMGEYEDVDSAMKKAERVVLDSNPFVDAVNFESAEVLDKLTQEVKTSIICYSSDEVVGSVITGPELSIGTISDQMTP